jgi:hypothetical protein
LSYFLNVGLNTLTNVLTIIFLSLVCLFYINQISPYLWVFLHFQEYYAYNSCTRGLQNANPNQMRPNTCPKKLIMALIPIVRRFYLEYINIYTCLDTTLAQTLKLMCLGPLRYINFLFLIYNFLMWDLTLTSSLITISAVLHVCFQND